MLRHAPPRAFLGALLAAFLCATSLAAAPPERLALVGGMLPTGYEQVPPIHPAPILLEGDRIVAAAHRNDIPVMAHVRAEADVRNLPVGRASSRKGRRRARRHDSVACEP